MALKTNVDQLVKKLTTAVDNFVNANMRAAATGALQELVNSTPVDTGAAVSNWVVTLGGPSGQGFQSPHVPGKRGSTRDANKIITFQKGVEVIETFNLFAFKMIYISNATPYLPALNRGSSKQAPAGFVETAVMNARFSMKRVKLKV